MAAVVDEPNRGAENILNLGLNLNLRRRFSEVRGSEVGLRKTLKSATWRGPDSLH